MPFTPLHFIPGLMVYLLLFPYVDALALALSVVFIDIEPIINLFILRSFPLHGLFHSLIGALLLAAPILVLGCRLLETRKRMLAKVFNAFGWNPELREVSIGTTAFSVYIGLATHLILDYWMHDDIAVFYPFGDGNPFQSYDLASRSQAGLFFGLIVSPLLWFVGKRVHKREPFKCFP